MATRGPKKKSAAKAPPKPPSAAWEGFAPPDLDPIAVREFARLVAALKARGTFDRTDPCLVVAAARTVSILDRAEAELATTPELTLSTPNGTTMPHPMLGVANAATQRLRGLMKDLGLTAATARLGEAKPEATQWDGLLNVAG